MSKETALKILLAVGHGARLGFCIIFSVVFSFSVATPKFEIESGAETVVYVGLSAFMLYMLWDYTRLTFKRVWNDR